MERDIKTLTKYLITKGIESPSKIQKVLFFLRVEELKSKNTKNSFFKQDNNFQAWIYGPVCVESFKFAQGYFDQFEEKEPFLLSDKDMKIIDEQYLKPLSKYINMSPKELIDKSHTNVAWIKARIGLSADEICKNYLIEDEDFTRFEDGN